MNREFIALKIYWDVSFLINANAISINFWSGSKKCTKLKCERKAKESEEEMLGGDESWVIVKEIYQNNTFLINSILIISRSEPVHEDEPIPQDEPDYEYEFMDAPDNEP